MTRYRKDPLRRLTTEERQALERLSRAQDAPAIQIARATLLLAVADGMSYLDAARSVGRRSYSAVSELVSRFNRDGLDIFTVRNGSQPTDTSKRSIQT